MVLIECIIERRGIFIPRLSIIHYLKKFYFKYNHQFWKLFPFGKFKREDGSEVTL